MVPHLNRSMEKRRKVTVNPKSSGMQNSFANKLNDMFKNSKVPPGAKRPSFLVGMPQRKGGIGTFSGGGGGGNNLGIIKEEPDKMKSGYDPAASLTQTLDSVIVVKKDKKKKKKPKTFAG